MNDKQKTVVITGASNGIGRALAGKLLSEGYKVIAVVRSGTIEGLSHANLSVVQGDISSAISISHAIEKIAAMAVSVDYLINNAGVGPDLMEEVPTEEHMQTSFAINTTGTVLFTEGLLKYVKNGGHILFLSTAMALLRNAAPSGPAYRMSKAAINMYAVLLAQRLAEKDIVVTPLHPGWVQTRMGGQHAPVTITQSVDGIYKALTENKSSGKFWNIEVDGLQDF